jgi:tetratricopeptide (TPR) repeat protein
VQAEDALRRLLDLGLLEPEAMGSVRLHRLLAVFVRAVAHNTVAQMAVEDVLLATAERLIDAGYPAALLPLYPHLRAVTEAAQPREDVRTARLDAELGHALRMIGDYAGAQPSYERALTIMERVFGPRHPYVAVSLTNLGLLYYVQGRYAEAEPLLQRGLILLERGLGPDHPELASGLNNVADLYRHQGRYAEAEQLYQQALVVGAREHRASYLRTVPIAAHAWCEYREVRT